MKNQSMTTMMMRTMNGTIGNDGACLDGQDIDGFLDLHSGSRYIGGGAVVDGI